MTQDFSEFAIINDAAILNVSYENPKQFNGVNLDAELAKVANLAPLNLNAPQAETSLEI